MKHPIWFLVFALVIANMGTIGGYYMGRAESAEALAQIHAAYQELDPKDYLTLPAERKDACLEWAFGKDWEAIRWDERDDRFRDLHPELDPEDFAGHTEINVFWKRLQRTYLDLDDTQLVFDTLYSNDGCLISFDSNGVCTFIDPNVVRDLAQSGRICEVMGHQWEIGEFRDVAVADLILIGTLDNEVQICGLCGKTRTRTR